MNLRIVSYEEARREFFLQKKQEAERKLQYWKKRLSPKMQMSTIHIDQKCSDLGQEICFYQDALEATADYVRRNGCEFCKKFDFSEARCEVNGKYAHVSLACGSTRFPKEEQFRYCPKCGRRIDEGG